MRFQRRILQSVLLSFPDFKFTTYKRLHRACSASLALSCAARLSGYDPLCSILGHNTPSVLPTRKFTCFSSTSHLRQYDRSGRSTGTAFITYPTMGEAMAAKKKLDGQLAKGSFLSCMTSLVNRLFILPFMPQAKNSPSSLKTPRSAHAEAQSPQAGRTPSSTACKSLRLRQD
jgi:hypothetical protein